nr:MAG TPA: helix-turn-helix domain protein [Caudoviricetes sp.]
MKEKETITDRISQIIEKEGHSVSTFAKKLGIPWTTANNIISGRNSPNYESLVKIIENFAWVDANWLVMGEEAARDDVDKKKLYAMIEAQQKTIEKQQDTIDRLTERLLKDLPDTGKKVAVAG